MKNTTLTILSAVALTTLAGCSLIPGNDMDDDIMSGNTNTGMMNDDVTMVGGAAMYKDKDIVTNVMNAPTLTTLVAGVKAAGLVETLQGPGPFTVFGPDNIAFDKLPAGTLDMLLKPENKAMLAKILTYHVVPGTYTSADLTDGKQLMTVEGEQLMVKRDGNTIMIMSMTQGNVATITTADVMQSNGVAHVIDTVLLPMMDTANTDKDTVMVGGAAMYRNKDIIANVMNASNLTTLVAAVQAAGLVEVLQGPGPFTVFGPDNMAFDKLPAGTVDNLLKPENKDMLAKILTYHVVPGIYTSADLTDGKQLTTVQGEQLMVKRDGNTVMIMSMTEGNVATVTQADVMQSNGVAHVIDTVLMPK